MQNVPNILAQHLVPSSLICIHFEPNHDLGASMYGLNHQDTSGMIDYLSWNHSVAPLATDNEFLAGDFSINWIKRSERKKSTYPLSDGLHRATIQDLLQQEACDQLCNRTIDQPSQLVRVECYKMGCRCVLKREPALAMKIVTAISIVQGTWHSNQSNSLFQSSSVTSLHDNWLKFPKLSHQRSKSSKSHSQMSLLGAMSERFLSPNPSRENINKESNNNSSTPIILTSCCPSWFEIIQKSPTGPTDISPCKGPPLPTWTSVNSLAKANPSLVLVRKPIRCFIVKNSTQIDTATLLTGPYILTVGTVLQLFGQKFCNIEEKGRKHVLNQRMLQCAIIGGKTINDVLSKIPLLEPTDCALENLSQSLSDSTSSSFNNPLIYLSFDEKHTMFSPIAPTSMLQGQVSIGNDVAPWSGGGVHSLINLLTNYRLPILVKPILGKSIADWLPTGQQNNSGLETLDEFSGFLKITNCYNGVLIFLEPINDCDDKDLDTIGSKQSNSRFFVVTSEMLADHAFLIADQPSCERNISRLRTHANRVAHFLAACHPVYGLAYLLKYAENVTQNSSTGPVHMPLTRSLGPSNLYHRQITLKSTLASVAAMAALHLGEMTTSVPIQQTPMIKSSSENHSSGSSVMSKSSDLENSMVMNEILNEIEDIYFYVRTGRFPNSSKYSLQSTNIASTELGLKYRSQSVAISNVTNPVKMTHHPANHNGKIMTLLSPNITHHHAPTQLVDPSLMDKTLNHARQKSHELKTSLTQCLPMLKQGSTLNRSPYKVSPVIPPQMMSSQNATISRSKSTVRQQTCTMPPTGFYPQKQIVSPSQCCSPISPLRIVNIPPHQPRGQIYLIQQPYVQPQQQQQLLQLISQPQYFVEQPELPSQGFIPVPEQDFVHHSLTDSMMLLVPRTQTSQQIIMTPQLNHLSSLTSSMSEAAGGVVQNSNESTLASQMKTLPLNVSTGLGGFRHCPGQDTATHFLLNRKDSNASHSKLNVPSRTHSIVEVTRATERPINSSPDTGLGGDSSVTAAMNLVWTMQQQECQMITE